MAKPGRSMANVTPIQGWSAPQELPWLESFEHAVLAAVLLQPEALGRLRGDLGIEAVDFYLDRHQATWRAYEQLADADESIDLRTVEAKLVAAGHFAEMGGMAWLSGLDQALPDLGRAIEYGRKVRELSLLRRAIAACEVGVRDLYSGVLAQPLEELQATLAKIAELQPQRGSMMDVAAIAEDHPDPVNEDRPQGITFDLPRLDNAIFGLQRGEQTVLAGRSGMGKSAVGLGLTARACKAGLNTLFFSIEMSHTQVLDRLIGAEAGVPASGIQGRNLSDNHLRMYEAGRQEVARWPLAIDESASVTASYIEACCRRRVRQTGRPLDFVVIDYLQKMELPGGDELRYAQIGHNSWRMKVLAKELNCAVLLLCQLRRPRDGDESERPAITGLRESGDIEQNASCVLGIYREQPNTLGEDPNDYPSIVPKILEVHVLKNRYGPQTLVPLMFDGAYQQLDNLDNHEISEWLRWRQQ